jgi:SAM-dependent methyltransferase
LEPHTYQLAAAVEDRHWWFRGRRSVLRALLDRHLGAGPQGRDILEVGCGNGGNLALLAAYGRVFAVELDDAARARAVQRGLARVETGQLPGALPFPGQRFDLIAALDVLEHVEDDEASLRALRERLKPGGLALLTVPAYQWMWGANDRVSHHLRRYSGDGLRSLLARSGFAPDYFGHFNTLLFPLAVAQVKLGRVLQADRYAGVRIPPAPLNRLLEGVFSLERFIAPRFSLPYGLSLVALARAGRE